MRIDQAETLRRMAVASPNRWPRSFRASGRTRSPARRKAAARSTTLSPSATPAWISTQPPSVTPAFTCRTSTLPSRTTSRRASSPSRSNAVAGTPTPSRRASSTWPEAKAPIWAWLTSPSAIRTLPVRLALSTSWLTRRTRPETAPSTPGSFSSAGMPTARRASVCSGTSASRSIAPSSMMRNSGSPEVEAAAPSLADRRLTIPDTGALTSVRSMRTRSSCRSASRLLRSASATPSAFWAAAS